jgi:hypothetical protein
VIYFIYSLDWSAYSAAGKYVDRSWEYLIAHRHMDVEIGTEAAQFLFCEYITGIIVTAGQFHKRNSFPCIFEKFLNSVGRLMDAAIF